VTGTSGGAGPGGQDESAIAPHRKERRLEPAVRAGLFSLGGLEFAVISLPLPSYDLFPELTAAQWEVCEGLLRGQSNAEIARERHTSRRTVANQVRAVYERLEVTSRAELAALQVARRERISARRVA
jgi:DNA-binding NarL/FixJ family response regulator